MESENIEEELKKFNEICIDCDSNSDTKDNYEYYLHYFKRSPPAPRPPPEPEKYVNFEKYIEEKCENKIKILDRSTFHLINRPIVIAFNHFREKCYHHTKRLDVFYQLALKYENRIEFIVADQMDMDFMFPHANSIDFFCLLVRPEVESCNIYAIDEKRRIHTHYDAYQNMETLSELCDNLLNDKLYLTQSMPEKTNSFVNICVHENYEELVLKSTRDILLIIYLTDYRPHAEHEPDYEQIAAYLKDSNVDVFYIDGFKNYVPFEYNVNGYPTILFIPHDDKSDFAHFSGVPRNTENIMNFIKENIGAEGRIRRANEKMKMQYKPFILPANKKLQFSDFSECLKNNFSKSFQILDRNTFNIDKYKHKCVIINFLDFKRNGIEFYMSTLQNMHQVAAAGNCYSVSYLVADLEDITILYPQWHHKYIDLDIVKETPQMFAIDRMKRISKIDEIKTASGFFYFAFSLTYSAFNYSQPWSMSNNSNLVITCVADNLGIFIKKSQTDIFLTIYCPTYKASFKLLNVLDEIAEEAKEMYVKMLKMDAKHNFVPLEYANSSYPVHYYIPRQNKDKRTVRFISAHQSKEEILAFIRSNVEARE